MFLLCLCCGPEGNCSVILKKYLILIEREKKRGIRKLNSDEMEEKVRNNN